MRQYKRFKRLTLKTRFIIKMMKIRKKLVKQKPFDLAASRKARKKNMGFVCGSVCGDVKIETVNWGGHNASILTPPQIIDDCIVLYLHGGAYIGSDIEIYNGFVSRFASELKLKCINLDYPLAPEFPYPHAVDALTDFYFQLIKNNYPPNKIIFAGDSAGAGLCLSASLKLKEKGLLPAAFILFSPWIDLTNSGDSIEKNKNTDYMITGQLLENAAKLYCGGSDSFNPYISPLFADFKNFPPIYILASAEEILLSDSERLHSALERDNVDVHFSVWEGTQHAFVVGMRLFPESKVVIEEIKDFIHLHCLRGGKSH